MDAAQMKATCRALLVTIHHAGEVGAPSGHLYAAVMGHLSLSEYQECVDCLKAIGAVTERGHVLTVAKAFAKRGDPMKVPQVEALPGMTPLGIRPARHTADQVDAFMVAYAPALTAAHAAGKYEWPLAMLPTVTARMRAAFEAGSYNHGGPAMRLACKALGIKHTRTAIEAFLGRGK